MPYRPDEIILPDLYDVADVGTFVESLSAQLDRYGVKKLRKEAQNIYARLRHIQRSEKEMKRLLKVVNGKPTPAQHQYYEEKKIRTAAQRFYSAMSDQGLETYASALGFVCKGATREEIIATLIDAHIQRELNTAWADAAQLAEASGYMGVEETERVLQSGSE